MKPARTAKRLKRRALLKFGQVEADDYRQVMVIRSMPNCRRYIIRNSGRERRKPIIIARPYRLIAPGKLDKYPPPMSRHSDRLMMAQLHARHHS